HVAAAVGTPVAVLFASTSAELTCPGLPGDPRHYFAVSGAACSPCFRRTCPIDLRCMNSLPSTRMIEGVLQILRNRGE
ncbi:MAG TPA: glycosyltransferase family 9 protein, partial [Chthonomonadaceae bacterium]|nr:glycosyltransferase family 9 protein [Chthonomonadaceae bacterium]